MRTASDVIRALRTYDVTPFVRYRYQRNNRTGEQTDIPYLEWHSVADILDEVCPRWEKEVYPLEVHGNFAVARVKLTVYGEDGSFVSREAAGNESLEHLSDPFASAESQAFKRAAAFLGVGRSLYDSVARQNLPAQQAQQSSAGQSVQQPHRSPAPAKPQAVQRVKDLPQAARDQTIVQFENKCSRYGIDLETLKDIVHQVCGSNFPTDYSSIEFLVLSLPTAKAREVFNALDEWAKVAAR